MRCDLRLGDSRLQWLNKLSIRLSSCDLRLGDSRLQYLNQEQYDKIRCDLRLGDSRLQYIRSPYSRKRGCDLRLGDSRLQFDCLKRFNTRATIIFSSQKNDSCSGAFSIGWRFFSTL